VSEIHFVETFSYDNPMKNKWNTRYESCQTPSKGALCCAGMLWPMESDFLLKYFTQKSTRVNLLHEERVYI